MGTPIDLIVGLGNPGPEYEATRHNAGFWFVDLLAREHRGVFSRERKLHGEAAEIAIAGQRIRLLKPTTYMNLSGDSVKALAKRYEAKPEDVVVAVDDVALPFGRIRVRPGGGAGGHNGLKSIIARLGTQEFPRVRMGIAPDHPVDDLARFVLQPFPRAARDEVDKMLWTAADAVESILTEGVETAMQRFNPGGQ